MLTEESNLNSSPASKKCQFNTKSMQNSFFYIKLENGAKQLFRLQIIKLGKEYGLGILK